MASAPFTQFSFMPRIYKWHTNWNAFPYMNLVQLQHYQVNDKVLRAVSRSEKIDSYGQEVSNGEEGIKQKKSSRTTKRSSPGTMGKAATDSPDESSVANGSVSDGEIVATSGLNENSKKTRTRTRKKAPLASGIPEEETTEKVTRRRRTKKSAPLEESQIKETEFSDSEASIFDVTLDDSEEELDVNLDDGEDISYTYGWPPLVCCFGAAQHAFVPSGRRANRLIDYEIHERRKDAMWAPEKFVRASGGCTSNVAVALASLGGKVAFMGKLGDDAYGQSLLYFMNINKVQTRSVRIDGKRSTAISQMKMGKRGGLRMTSTKPCAEDCLTKSEINIDVLKEAKMFYFNTFSLLDRNMRSTAFQAIKISKKLGSVIFYDLNLPLPLWHSSEETKIFIQKAWNLANIIEVTKQELEFLCGITPTEKFDTKDNDRSKFTHYPPEVVNQLWHENLKVLFVTNGTSKIHYYTKEHNGEVRGMEDAPLTPFTADMSASGDGIAAGILRMLTVQPHLICDKGYLERTIRYAISCGVIDQWLQGRSRGFPPKEGMEDVEPDMNGIKSVTEREYRTIVPIPAT
ncbi:fructokinase-like 2, chloroplastic isoform X1 [Primulina tabacum]|uniref:fructokinase-like 2, chloroplastic isoform X1 n=1 Tax=Primulina tabacum TaxID=48773 RepID=UPI003F59A65F